MGIFGWSLPPGCGTLPGEEEGALELHAPNMPPGYTAWWDEWGNVLLQDGEGYLVKPLLLHIEWDDCLSEAANLAAANDALCAHFERRKK